jgi:hypothetical protein
MNKTDIEILQADSKALDELVDSILENKRLAWMIVDGWLKVNNYVMIHPDEWKLTPKAEPSA